jgi:hypothetical protein
MASPSRTPEREEERRSNTLTLVIASVASASAALVVSQLWIAGTWIAAALTPVLVALFSELLHRPTQRISRGLTSDRPALAESSPEPRESDAPIRIYRAGSTEPARPRSTAAARTRRRKIAYGTVFTTAAIALAIAVAALTIPELVAGQSVGRNNGRTTFFGGGGKKKTKEQQTPTSPTTTEQQTETQSTTSTEGTTPTETNTTPSTTTPPATTAPTPTTTTP